MCRSIVAAASFAAILVVNSVLADEMLNIGDSAPALSVSQWIKGEKVDDFAAGKTYVIEFWATWCGPCRASIPHLTELAHQFKDKDVQFVGVDVWENDPRKVQSFVSEMGDKMDYRVALDKIPEGGDAKDALMAKHWLSAAEEYGIPTAFVIHDKKIAWIGHPMELQKPLEKIIAGDWDLAEATNKRLVEKALERKIAAAREEIFTAYRAKDYAAAIAAIDDAAKDDPEISEEFAAIKYAALCNGAHVEQGLELGAKLLEKYRDSDGSLNNLAWKVIDPNSIDKVDPLVANFALKAASRAVELSKENRPEFLDTLAEAQFRTGDAASAVTTEEKAIKLLKEQVNDLTPEDLKEFTDHLDRYSHSAAPSAEHK